MQVEELTLPGVKLIKNRVFIDERGFFRETFRQSTYAEKGIECSFVQDNHSFSHKGTLRGMHFQRIPGQAKLISVIYGKIYDVVVDIRRNSPNYRQWLGVYLDAQSAEQLFVPVGYAHGFFVVSETAHVCYKVSALYNPSEEKGFCFNDPAIGIVWPDLPSLISEKDRSSPWLEEVAL